jgi:hypothetical protein
MGFEGIPKAFAGDIEEVDALRAEDPLWSGSELCQPSSAKTLVGFV